MLGMHFIDFLAIKISDVMLFENPKEILTGGKYMLYFLKN